MISVLLEATKENFRPTNLLKDEVIGGDKKDIGLRDEKEPKPHQLQRLTIACKCKDMIEQRLEEVDQFKYLGSTQTTDETPVKDVEVGLAKSSSSNRGERHDSNLPKMADKGCGTPSLQDNSRPKEWTDR